MSDEITSQDIKDLVKELQKLTRQQGSDSTRSSRRTRQEIEGAGKQGEAKRDLERYEKEILLLEQQKQTTDGLNRSEELRLRQIKESMDLRRQLAEEEQKVIKQQEFYQRQLERLQQIEAEGGALTDAQIKKKKLLQTRMMTLNKETAELTNQLNKLTKAQNDASRAADRGAGKFNLLTEKFTKVGGAAYEFAMHMPLSVSELKNFGLAMVDSIKSGELYLDVFKKLIAEGFNLSMALDSVNAELSRSTGLFQETGTIVDQQAKTIRKVESANRILGVTAQETAQAMGALQSSMADFTRMSKSDQDSILNTATVMQELQVSAGTSAQIFDKATKSLGYQNNEIRGIADELHATAQSLGVPFKQIADDFNMVATELAFYGESAIDVFKDLSKQSKATGLSMQQLLKIGGEAFNTFDGAAQKVGRLNAILGGPYLNSIDMLNASEAERIDLIKQSMDASGQMFNDLSKYEQMAIADALGVSTEEARRLFGELDASQEMDIRQKEKMEETARKAQATMDKLTNAFMSLVVALDPVVGFFSLIVEGISDFLNTPIVKKIMQITLYALGFVGALMGIGKALAALGAMFSAAGAALTTFGFGLGGLGTMLTAAGGGLGAFGAGMMAAAAPLLPIIGVIAAVTTVVMILYKHFKNLSEEGASFGAFFTDIAQKVLLFTGPIGIAISLVISLFRHLKSGQGIIEALKNTVFDFLNNISFGLLGKLFGFGTNVDRGSFGFNKPKSVNDAIITTDGQIIEPSKQDTIIAAKPGGPIMDSLAAAATPLSDLAVSAMSPILNLLGGGTSNNTTNNTVNNPSMKQQAPNINVIVKIGERQLRDIFIDVLRDTTASSEISGFGGR
jgi:hypothetical protein